MAQTQVILLERIESLGKMGDTVSVRPGYARNYLLPQKKALRATKSNIAYFEAQRKQLEADNDKRKKEAEKLAKKLDGIKIPLIRQASEAGQLFGSVTARDIAIGASEVSKEAVTREMVYLNQNFKFIGLFPVSIAVHPEVKVTVTINIARTVEEAETQAKTGKALIATGEDNAENAAEKGEDETALEGVLEEGALEAQKKKKAETKEEAEKAAADQEKSQAKASKKAAKAKKSQEQPVEEAEAE